MILISLISGAAFMIAFGTTPDAAHGIYVPTGQGYIKLCRYECGDAIDDGITVYTASGAADTICYSAASL